jgi:hypothetical protein
MKPMLAVEEVAVSVAVVDFTGAASAAAACMPEASMAAAIALPAVHAPHIR